MLKIRGILLSGLVALLMVGMITATVVAAELEGDNTEDQFIGAYIGTWTKTSLGRECINTQYWQCIRLIVDVSVPW